MNILVTAGNTQMPIDKVRCLTNIFTGRTGAQIALEGQRRGHCVTLLTSHPDAIAELQAPPIERWQARRYRTFDDLQADMAELMRTGGFDAVIHSAAVSDYQADGIYAPDSQTRFHAAERRWEGAPPTFIDMAAGKIKSDAPELWLRLVRAPKIIDQVRTAWAFRGVLVKFKLEVGVAEATLLGIAERSRVHSGADLMVANTLEEATQWAYLGPLVGGYQRIARSELASRLLEAVERCHQERSHG